MTHHKHDLFRFYLPAFYLTRGVSFLLSLAYLVNATSPQDGIGGILIAVIAPLYLWFLVALALLITQSVRNLGYERKTRTTQLVHRISLALYVFSFVQGLILLIIRMEEGSPLNYLQFALIFFLAISLISAVLAALCFLVGFGITSLRLKKLASQPGFTPSGKITIQ